MPVRFARNEVVLRVDLRVPRRLLPQRLRRGKPEVVQQRAAYDKFWRAAGDMLLAGTIPATDAATVANSIPGSQPGFRQRLGISRCRLDLPSRILC